MKEPFHFTHINDNEINKLIAPQNFLYRPVIRWDIFFVSLFFFLLAQLGLALLEVNLFCDGSLFILIPVNFVLSFLGIARYFFVFLIHCYQRYASAQTRLKCCMYPSCSQYTAMAIKRYGFFIGGIKGYRHYKKCGPPGGIEYP
ncbi:membrane protein insertion efficiency factor YidD [Hallerella succinigenes]|uniref:membrane protein insertion efficiency factor YidD n=1 Tax=Hallerella succinigenes TaxID=1896222 RepID=UPI000D0E1377